MHGVEYKPKSFTLNTETYISVKKLFWSTQLRCNLYSLAIFYIGGDDIIGELENCFTATEDEVNIEMVKRTIAWLRVK